MIGRPGGRRPAAPLLAAIAAMSVLVLLRVVLHIVPEDFIQGHLPAPIAGLWRGFLVAVGGQADPAADRAIATDVHAVLRSACVAGFAVWAAVAGWRQVASATGWWLIGSAMVAWLAGDAIWLVAAVRGEQPWTSLVANAAFLMAYPLLCLGSLRLPRQSLGARELRRLAIDLCMVGAAGSLLVWDVVIQPTLARNAATGVAEIMALAFPIADLVLAVCVIHLLATRPDPSWNGPGTLLALGLAVLIPVDIVFGWQLAHGAYASGNALGIGWTAALALIGLAAGMAAAHPPGEAAAPATARAHAPALAMVLSVGSLGMALLSVWYHHIGSPPTAYAIILVAMLGLLVLRLISTLADGIALQRALRVARDGSERLVQERTADLNRTISALRTAVADAERARSAEAEARRLAETLSRTAAAVAAATDLEAAFRAILGCADAVLDHDASAIGLAGSGTIRWTSHRGHAERGSGAFLDGQRLPIDRLAELGLAGELALAGGRPQALWSDGAPVLADAPALRWVRALAAAPLLNQGRLLGVIAVARGPGCQPFAPAELQRLGAFAGQAALALANQLLLAEARDRAQRLALVAELSARVSAREEVPAVLAAAVEGAARLLRADRSAIALVDRDGERLTVVADHTRPGLPAAAGAVLHRGQHPQLFEAVSRLQGMAVHDPRSDDRLTGLLPARHGETRAQLAIPLALGGQSLGLLVVEAAQSGLPYSPADEELAGTVAALMAVRIDLARRLAAETEARRAAEAASAAKSAFLASTSHELRTPLNGIIGALDLVLAGMCADSADQDDLLRTAHLSATRLLETINGLLDLSRIEAGRLEAVPEALDLRAIADEVVALLLPRAQAKGLRMAVRADPGLPAAFADPRLTRQILINLVGNAVKFTDHGGVELRLGLREHKLAVEVADTGVGIAAEELPRLFRPFVQADSGPSRRYEGTGLGLAIAKAMAEHLGGSLALASPGRGQGTTARLILPAVFPGTGPG